MTLEQFKLKQYRILARETKQHLSNLLAHRAGANQCTLGFLDTLEEKYEAELIQLKMRIRMYTPLKEGEVSTLLSAGDIAMAKLIPISTFIKVPVHNKAVCLFHIDKQPSMHVYGTTYHCFTCSAHGSVIDIVMKIKNCSFTQAVRFLIGK